MKYFPAMFNEAWILDYQSAADAKKRYTQGYRMNKADKVQDVLLHHGVHETTVKSYVEASLTLGKQYRVSIAISANATVKRGLCTCPAGLNGVCKHVAAILCGSCWMWYVQDISLSPTLLHV